MDTTRRLPDGELAVMQALWDLEPPVTSGELQQRLKESHPMALTTPVSYTHLDVYKRQVLDALITNFHLPESTLIMLVSALAGREHVLAAYEEAVKERYRFFSFGDAMFIS